MLWKKGWYETRTRLLIVLAVVVVITVLTMDPAPAGAGSGPLVGATTIPAMLAALLLAGAGVKTQLGGLQRSKGLHGSMYYTLSLPVTRTFRWVWQKRREYSSLRGLRSGWCTPLFDSYLSTCSNRAWSRSSVSR